MTRLAVIGTGRMGQLVAALAPEMGCELTAHLGRAETLGGLTADALGGAEIAIEFTVPTSAARMVRACVDVGVPVVSGTTGWDAERTSIGDYVHVKGGALLWAPNFAFGVHLFTKVVAEATRRFGLEGAGFDAHIVETHHAAKRDAPSGTARMLARVAEQARGREVPVTSIRTGNVPGTHEMIFDGAYEQVRVTHEARDRRAFAAGAITAARWLVGRRGVYTLDDVLGGTVGGTT